LTETRGVEINDDSPEAESPESNFANNVVAAMTNAHEMNINETTDLHSE
jgi:hypothetical protein